MHGDAGNLIQTSASLLQPSIPFRMQCGLSRFDSYSWRRKKKEEDEHAQILNQKS